jgi:hypothetical protein
MEYLRLPLPIDCGSIWMKGVDRMKISRKYLMMVLVVVVAAGDYFLGTLRSTNVAFALDQKSNEPSRMAAALSTAAFVSNTTVGASPEYAGQMAAEFYNSFMGAVK